MTATWRLRACSKKQVIRPLAEHVVDDLDADDARIFERFQPLLDLFDAHAIETNFAFPLKAIHRLKDLWTVVGFDRRTMQLHEVKNIDLERFKAILNKRR